MADQLSEFSFLGTILAHRMVLLIRDRPLLVASAPSESGFWQGGLQA
jgi:hypothetical protein